MKQLQLLTQALRFLQKVGPWLLVAADIIQYVNGRIEAQNAKLNAQPEKETPFGAGGPA